MWWVKVAVPLFALSMMMRDARATGQQDLILGSWTWNEHGRTHGEFEKAVHDEPSFTLIFHPGNSVEAAVFMPRIFGPHGELGGEGLSSNGHYHLKGGRLIMTRAHEPADGWPARSGTAAPYRYSCGLRMATDGKSFLLSGCAIAGSWVRVEEASTAPNLGAVQ